MIEYGAIYSGPVRRAFERIERGLGTRKGPMVIDNDGSTSLDPSLKIIAYPTWWGPIEWYRSDTDARLAYLGPFGADSFILQADAPFNELRLVAPNTVTANPSLLVGGSPGADAFGIQLFNVGAMSARRARADGPLIQVFRGAAGVGGIVGDSYLRMINVEAVAGNITLQAGDTVNYGTSSDYRLKDERGPISDGLDRVRQLRPRRVTWKADSEQTEVDAFFAHEVADIVPNAVVGDKDATDDEGRVESQQLDYAKLVPVLTAAVQELAQRVDALQTELNQLKAA